MDCQEGEVAYNFAIVGAGALGLYYGSLLQRSGEDVPLLLRRDYVANSTRGLRVESVADDFHLAHVTGYRDSIVIGVVDLVRPLVESRKVILTLHNGQGDEDSLSGAFPAGQLMGGVAFLSANRGEPGVVRHLGLGSLQIGMVGTAAG